MRGVAIGSAWYGFLALSVPFGPASLHGEVMHLCPALASEGDILMTLQGGA